MARQRAAGDRPGAASLLPVDQDRLSMLLRHQYGLSEAEDAFRCAADKSSGAVKVTLTP